MKKFESVTSLADGGLGEGGGGEVDLWDGSGVGSLDGDHCDGWVD